jgi:hypothetical protein
VSVGLAASLAVPARYSGARLACVTCSAPTRVTNMSTPQAVQVPDQGLAPARQHHVGGLDIARTPCPTHGRSTSCSWAD